MKKILALVFVAIMAAGCVHYDDPDTAHGGGERIGESDSSRSSETMESVGEDEPQGGGERIGESDSSRASDISETADEDEPQGGGERIGDG